MGREDAPLPPTLLPSRLARLVSAMSRSSTVSLRLGTYIVETILDSARLGSITGLDVARRAVETLVFKAEEDVPDSGSATGAGVCIEYCFMVNFAVVRNLC